MLRNKLTFKFFLTVILCSMIFAALSIALQVFLSYRSETTRIKNNIKFIEKSYLPSIADSLYNMDEPLLRLLLQGARQLQGIQYCEVSEKRNERIYKIFEGNPNNGKDIVREFKLQYRSRKDDEPIDIGLLTVFADFEGVRAHLWSQAELNILISIVQIFATAFIVLIIFQIMVSRHLTKMAGYAKELSIDNLDPALILNRRPVEDELSLVTDAINDLRERVKLDLEQRKRQEKELKFSHDRFRIVMDSLDASVYVADMKTYDLLFINKYIRDHWGNVVGKTCWKTLQLNQTGPCPFCTNEKLVNNNGQPTDIYVWELQNTMDNQWYECRDQAIRWVDGRIVRMEIATNITERKQAEEAIKQSEEKYRNLFENLYDVYYRTDNKGIITLASPSVENHLGYAPDELIGQPAKNLYVDQPKREELLSLIFKHGHVDDFEMQLKRKDTSVIWASTNSKLLKDEKGEFVGVEGTARDVTDRKELEGRLAKAQKMEAIGTLAGGIAHDFNNILSSVFGFTELALEDAIKGSSQHEYLQEILIAGNRAKNLVKQILTFSRQTDQEQKPVQVKPIVKEALNLLRASIPTTINIEENIQSNALVMGDSTQIHQILVNLCTNAAHAMEADGGLLTVGLFDVELDSEFVSSHSDLKPGPYINLTVSDTGHGISNDVMNKIFDPFFTTKEKGKGTGMGLSVVHGIVRNYSGNIYVYSEPGKGSTFKVYLPSVQRHLKPEEIDETLIPTGTERILFIDDEPAIANIGKQILNSLGYDVTTRTSSIEALELFKAQKYRFDIVITDMTMPQMTGDNLTKEILKIRSSMPVILCTGFSSRIDEKKASEIGIRAFVTKPILKKEIAHTIRKVLDEK